MNFEPLFLPKSFLIMPAPAFVNCTRGAAHHVIVDLRDNGFADYQVPTRRR